jgi:c-di-GMP-binding flagellar brake protein YcgR
MSDVVYEAAGKPGHKGWQRRYPRYRTDIPMKAVVLRDDGYIELRGRCSDIGEGGLGAVLTDDLLPGEVVSLQIALDRQAESLRVRAIVRYRKGLVYGFEFLGLSSDQQQAVKVLCQSLKPLD